MRSEIAAERDEVPERTEDALEEGRPVPARSRALEVARRGFRRFAPNQEPNERKLAIAQYRACRALLWTREQILEETGWSRQWLASVERLAREEDSVLLEKGADPVEIFTEYREAQLLAARELEDLAQIFRSSKQFSALVGAVKARSEILDKIIKTGQELGLIRRAAKEIRVRGKVNYETKTIKELRLLLRGEFEEMQRLIRAPGEVVSGPAAAVLRRVLPPANAESAVNPSRKKPRVKKLAG